jgi:hypothetical protein
LEESTPERRDNYNRNTKVCPKNRKISIDFLEESTPERRDNYNRNTKVCPKNRTISRARQSRVIVGD